ncbi:MAG: hypothetical protein OXC91_09040, partial [Rhodobacteraceae bacterium]|nr:hypothetical protein [Paracoccaceae bacterium]
MFRMAGDAAAQASGATLAGGTGFTGYCEPTIRTEDNGLQSQWMRPVPSRNHTRSARTSKRLRASRPQAM